MNEEVKACPFCGKDASISDGSNGLHFRVICNHSGCRAAGPLERCAIDAKDAWNTRTPVSCSPDVEALVEKLARVISPVWFTEDGSPPIVNNFPDQHFRYQEAAREKARAFLSDALAMMREKDAMAEALRHIAYLREANPNAEAEDCAAAMETEARAALDMTVDKGE